MTDSRYGSLFANTIGRTSRTLLDVLKGPDCAMRQERVQELVRIYQPVWAAVAKSVLLKYGAIENATMDAHDIVGDEVLRMLDPAREWPGPNAPDIGKLRPWIKTCIRNRVIDELRRRRIKPVSPEDLEIPQATLDALIDEREMYELFRVAMVIAERLAGERGIQEEYDIFRFVKTGRAPEHWTARREKELTEWKKRIAVSRIWQIIRDEAIPAAALQVSNSPDDAEETAIEMWDSIRSRPRVDLPE